MNNKLHLNGEVVAEDVVARLGKMCWGNSHEKLIQKYYHDGEYFSLNDIKNTLKTMFAMYESAKNGGKEITLQQVDFNYK